MPPLSPETAEQTLRAMVEGAMSRIDTVELTEPQANAVDDAMREYLPQAIATIIEQHVGVQL